MKTEIIKRLITPNKNLIYKNYVGEKNKSFNKSRNYGKPCGIKPNFIEWSFIMTNL